MASGIYNSFKGQILGGLVDLDDGGDTIKVSLYDNSHAFSATDTEYTTTNELATEGGYTQGGATLTGQAVAAGATTKWDATDVSWAEATFTAYHAVIWDDTASNALICSIDFGGAKTVSAGTFTIQWHADGIITLASA